MIHRWLQPASSCGVCYFVFPVYFFLELLVIFQYWRQQVHGSDQRWAFGEAAAAGPWGSGRHWLSIAVDFCVRLGSQVGIVSLVSLLRFLFLLFFWGNFIKCLSSEGISKGSRSVVESVLLLSSVSGNIILKCARIQLCLVAITPVFLPQWFLLILYRFFAVFLGIH